MSTRSGWLAPRLNRWARRRHGVQLSPVTLRSNRIYILPSRSGVVFGLMLFVMLLGSMNYNNSMGLGLAFLLGSIVLVIMHHCHRNLLGLQIQYHPPQAVFAGQDAKLDIALHNSNQHVRSDLLARVAERVAIAVNTPSQEFVSVALAVQTHTRGIQSIPRLSVSTRYPAGLFRAWTWVYWDLQVLVYPQPAGTQALPEYGSGNQTGANLRSRGDDELAELRDYQRGDPLNRVAWKHYARSGELHSKTFDEPRALDLCLEWNQVRTTDIEARLAQLCSWVLQADAQKRTYGLRLPTVDITPNTGLAHRETCLKALALYE